MEAGIPLENQSELMAANTVPAVTYSDIIIISPDKKDTGVDINSSISVSCNPDRYASKIRLSALVVTNGAKTVEGKIISSDSNVVFIPNVNLDTNTRYTVEIRGIVTITPDKEIQPVTEGFDRKWSFTTGAASLYHMHRQSQAVTDFARDGSRMMQMGDYLYLYGGWTGLAGSHNDIYRSSGDLSVWEKLPDAPWQGRHTFGIGKIGSELFIFGGDQHTEFFDVWKSSDGQHFEPVAHDLDNSVKERLIYGSCVHRNKLYIMGGQSNIEELNAGLTDVWTSPNGSAWRRMASGQDFLGKNLAGVVTSFNGRLWVLGGGYYGHPDSAVRWTNHVYSSVDGSSWTREPDAPWAGRQFADVCVWDGKIWMIGGHNGQNLAEIWYMNKDGSWIEYEPSNLFTARHATAVAVYNDKLVIACGDLNNECWVIEKAD